MKLILPLFLTLAMAAGSTGAVGADTPSTSEARLLAVQKLAEGLNYQQGDIELKGGIAKIHVPADFRYLDPKATATVLTDIWGNPPSGEHTLGMLVPAAVKPSEPEGWGIIITYEEDGYVKDDDAAKINYDELLQQMKEGTAEASKEREKEGYGSIALVGWATPPRYDAAEKKMYWAKELAFNNEPDHTLNYNIRILGRRGVLVLNAVAAMPQLTEIEKLTPSMLAAVNFQEGHRYADFNASTDKVAAYGLAALVTGGVLAKAGFFKVLLAGILALKKFVIIGVIALVAGLKKLFGGGKKTEA